jgi:nitric oxide reductase NorD protein
VTSTPPARSLHETSSISNAQRLATLARQRDGMAGPHAEAWRWVSALAAPTEQDAWAQAVLELAHVNVGPAALMTFWRITIADIGRLGVPALATIARAAAEIGRQAGARAARGALEARSQLVMALQSRDSSDESAVWRGLVRLAREAPFAFGPFLPHLAEVWDRGGAEGVESFVAAGLRLAAADGDRCEAFFSLRDPAARRMLEGLRARTRFAEMRGSLRMFTTALWGRPILLAGAELRPDGQPMRRATLAGGLAILPETFQAAPEGQQRSLFWACAAHVGAHIALGPARFAPGSLKPLQIVLIGLVEDARIETLAMRRFPGLRALWAPFHVARPSRPTTAPALLARLSRALFDPAYEDPDGFIAKGRALFAAELDLEDSALSRRIGGLLGNDIGQMRLQFSANGYVAEPPYRDDGLGLWQWPPPPDPTVPEYELQVEAARPNAKSDTAASEKTGDREPARQGRALAGPVPRRPPATAVYPEWDRAAGVERPNWATLREEMPALGDADAIELAIASEPGLRTRIERLARGVAIGRMHRLRRQREGEDFDLDAVIASEVARRSGDTPDERIYRSNRPRVRDIAILLLADSSQSTAKRVAGSASIISLEKQAIAVLGSALSRLGDRFALRAFASNGRDEVRYARIKEFDAPFDREAMARLSGLRSGLSTRLGTAMRHAGFELENVRASRKILLVLTDGAPSDIDVVDPLDLVEDAARVTRQLRGRGIDVFGVVIDEAGQGVGRAVFGRANHLPIARIEDLPARLSDLYFRVSRR